MSMEKMKNSDEMNTELQAQNKTKLSVNELLETKTKELEETYKKLSDLEQMKTHFLSTVSHELRSPLTSVLGFAENTLEFYKNDILPVLPMDNRKVKRRSKTIKQNLSIVVSECERTIRLIKDLLGITNVEAKNIEWSVQEVDILAVCQRVLSVVAGYPKSDQVAIYFEAPDNVRPVKGDPDILVQVIASFIRNAFKFTEHGSVILKVEPEKEHVKVSVTDTGKGIEEEDLSKIFEEFEQTNKTIRGNSLVTGLGLPICKDIIKRFGGTIWAESKGGKGSKVYFTLNYYLIEKAKPASLDLSITKMVYEDIDQGLTSNKKMDGRPNILVVDDDENILRLLYQELEDKYNVTLAESGEKAIRLFSDGSEHTMFDLVITDLMMKGMDGIGVLKEVKKRYPETVVIILTGHGQMQSAIDALRLDADDYIMKPYKPEKFHFSIERGLEKLELKRKVKLYEKILPVCCVCKKIRDDSGKAPGTGRWLDMESYIYGKTKVEVSHGYCPECFKKVKESCNIS